MPFKQGTLVDSTIQCDAEQLPKAADYYPRLPGFPTFLRVPIPRTAGRPAILDSGLAISKVHYTVFIQDAVSEMKYLLASSPAFCQDFQRLFG